MQKTTQTTKTKQLTRTLIAAAILTLSATTTHAQGIPVFDGANIAQQVQQVLSWGQQLKAMADQVQQQEQQFQAMTGNRGFGNIQNDPNLQKYIKEGIQSAEALRQQYGTNNPCKHLTDPQAMQYCQSVSNLPYENHNQVTQAVSIVDQKTQQIQGLIQAINQTTDPKSIAELQARIAGEQAGIQNEMVRMQLTLQTQQLKVELAKKQEELAASEQMRIQRENAYKKTAKENSKL